MGRKKYAMVQKVLILTLMLTCYDCQQVILDFFSPPLYPSASSIENSSLLWASCKDFWLE